MKLHAIVIWGERFEGEKAVYLTGKDTETGGDIKVSGEFGAVVLNRRCEIEAEVRGRQSQYGFNMQVVNGWRCVYLPEEALPVGVTAGVPVDIKGLPLPADGKGKGAPGKS